MFQFCFLFLLWFMFSLLCSYLFFQFYVLLFFGNGTGLCFIRSNFFLNFCANVSKKSLETIDKTVEAEEEMHRKLAIKIVSVPPYFCIPCFLLGNCVITFCIS
jgi:hypothetical protein